MALAKSYCEDVEFSPMDATRADVEFTAEVCAIAVEEGATVVNIPDTVGYTTPEEYAAYFRHLYELVPGLREVRASVHCHDDLGLAVANSYAGRAGRSPPGRVRHQRHRRARGQLLAGGDRDGAPDPRGRHGLDTGVNTSELARTSRMVSRLTGYPVQPNKAIVGRNAFAHESGIHQDGVLKERTTYEIMDATEVGLESNSIVLGKHSGRHALRDALEQLGFKVEGNALNAAFKRFKEIADRKKQVTALDLEAIVSDEMRERADAHELAWFEVEAGSRREPLAKVAVKMPSGEESVGESSGDGPVDAIFHAIQKATGPSASCASTRSRPSPGARTRWRGHRDAAHRRPPGTRPGRGHRTSSRPPPEPTCGPSPTPWRAPRPRGRGGDAERPPVERTSAALTPKTRGDASERQRAENDVRQDLGGHHRGLATDLIYIDLHLVHEVTSPQAFDGLRMAGAPVRRPDKTVATADHNVPTDGPSGALIADQLSADPDRDAGAQLRGVRHPDLLAGLRATGHRPRDRPGAGPDPARDDDRLRRQPHLHPRRLRRAGLRHRHLRGRARARHPVPGPEAAEDDADLLRGRAGRRASPPRT